MQNGGRVTLLGLCGFLVIAARASAADDFSGKFIGAALSVEIVPEAGAFAGTIQLGDQKFPLKAHVDHGNLTGTFKSGANEFPFNATLLNDTLTLSTSGTTYTLKKDLPVNPLAGAAAVNPLAAAGGTSVDLPPGYSLVTSTDSGKALSIERPDCTSVMAAMKLTFPDLEKFFGSRPNILGAYENARDHKSGTATFAVTSGGKQLKGLVSCKIGDNGATVAVIYAAADAAPAEWAKLMGNGSGADAPTADRGPVLTEYKFPDGTGSIGLVDGWTTDAQSCMQAVHIKGPANQVINMGVCASVITPDSQLVQTQRQLDANARRMGLRPMQPMKLLIAPYTTPIDAMSKLVPQFSKASQATGGYAIELDNLKELPQQIKPNLPNGKASLVSYGVIHTQPDGTREHFLAAARVEITPISNQSWMFYLTEMAGPDKSFPTDSPVMLSMINSLKENNDVIAAKSRQNIDASNQRFAQMQQAHKEQMEGYDRQNKAVEARSLTQSRSNTDFDEVIRGERTVLDTQTGTRTSVDLGNVDGIVDKLNETDPGRYKQIPLRDEIYPLPGGN